jgi:hypothetical protein
MDLDEYNVLFLGTRKLGSINAERLRHRFNRGNSILLERFNPPWPDEPYAIRSPRSCSRAHPE